MIGKLTAAAFLSTGLMMSGASAQTATTTTTTTAPQHNGEWRASKVVGVNVYNEANDKIGDIEDVILDKSGKVANVILGVGGFLGMGEHYVAVPFDKLKWVNEPVRTSGTTATTTTTTPAVTTTTNGAVTGVANRPVRAADEKWYPDHVVYNATKDQLKAMPQFKY